MKQYTYDAFISYRHTEPDKFAAELLHRQLETFRLPGSIAKKKDGRKKIERVFRDKDELPLTNNLEDPIMQALSASRYLIVICSPRLRESMWCRKEIETFIGMHGREKVFAVLIEGEPNESFPEELLYTQKEIVREDGVRETVRVPMEPLAADIRGKDKKAMKKALKTEILRLLAPMFDLNFDDLRQRHRERRMKRILAISTGAAAVCLAFGTVSTALALRIQSQKVQIEKQNGEIVAQNEEIVAQSGEIAAQAEKIQDQNRVLTEKQAETLAEEALRLLDAGDRDNAIRTAVQALTEYDGIKMPYTAEAQYALTESLYAYNASGYIKPFKRFETDGVIERMLVSADGNLLLTYDATDTLILWSLETGERLMELGDVETEYKFSFFGNEKVAYLDRERNLCLYDVASGAVKVVDMMQSTTSVWAEREGAYLVARGWDRTVVYDGATLERRFEYEKPEGYSLLGDVFCTEERIAFSESKEDTYELVLLNAGDGSAVRIPMERFSLKTLRFVDDVVYVLGNRAAEDYMSLDAEVFACDPDTGRILWRQVYAGSTGMLLLRPFAEGAENLLMVTGTEARLLNLKDGREADRYAIGTSPAGGAVSTVSDIFFVYTRNGEYHMIYVDQGTDYDMTHYFAGCSQNVKEFYTSSYGYLLLSYLDDKIILYDTSVAEGLTEDGIVTETRTDESLSFQDAAAYAEEHGLEKPAMTQYIFFAGEEGKTFVYNKDGSLDVYDSADMEQLAHFPDLNSSVRYYYGKDANGNYYVGGGSVSYQLNENFEMTACIEELVSVDAENNLLVLGKTDRTRYTVPIYTVEELLAMAQQYVIK